MKKSFEYVRSHFDYFMCVLARCCLAQVIFACWLIDACNISFAETGSLFIAITGLSAGMVLLGCSMWFGVLCAGFADVYLNWHDCSVQIYGAGLLFCGAISYFVLLPITGVAFSCLVTAVFIPVLSFGCYRDEPRIKDFVDSRLRRLVLWA